ncbi:MAG: hypothetical protein KF751_12950 [Nitrospira sp.]|nr:hypothetical protein [Nitrospira sp.]
MDITIHQGHIERVRQALQQQGIQYSLERVRALCPELTPDQVFLALDCLARRGLVELA